jgi:hypothetical protein
MELNLCSTFLFLCFSDVILAASMLERYQTTKLL